MQKQKLSTTQKAVKLVTEEGFSVTEASYKLKITTSAIHAALHRKECAERGICPTCRQVITQ